MCLNWACTESVRGEVSDGLPYLDRFSGLKLKTGTGFVLDIHVSGVYNYTCVWAAGGIAVRKKE